MNAPDWFDRLNLASDRDITCVALGAAVNEQIHGMPIPHCLIMFGGVALVGIGTRHACDWINARFPALPPRGTEG